MLKPSSSLSKNAQNAVPGPRAAHPTQALLMLHDHHPEETKHCKVTETGGACGKQEMFPSNKFRILDRKTMMSLMPPGEGT